MSYKNPTICLKCSLLATFLLFLQPVLAQLNPGELDRQLQAKQKLLGDNLVMMVWKDTLVYKKETGDFTSNTQAPVASCSQWLTAALVMQFVEEGKIALDDKVAKWLPEFERYNKNYITIRHCLSHMTGIEDEGKPLKRILQRKKFASLEDEVNAFAARDIRVNAGEDFWYGPVGLNIAGRVLEVISRKKFDVLIKQKLFNPLEMRRTTFTAPDAGAVNPSGGALSTPDDYMQFLVMLLNKGKYKDKQVLNEKSINTLMQVQTRPALMSYVPPAASGGFSYALGSWAIAEKNENATVLASPGLSGTWPMIDFCRGYAYLVFVKKLPGGEEKAEAHMELKKTIDTQLPSACR